MVYRRNKCSSLLIKYPKFFKVFLVAEDRSSLLTKLSKIIFRIDDRRIQVLQRRQTVKEVAQQRANILDSSKNYQEFFAEVHDLRTWIAEKLKTASDESYRDLANLERKIQKHEAFERELRANEGQLRTVNKLGMALIAQDNYRKDEVAATLQELNNEWQTLMGTSLEKGRRLRQAEMQHNYNNSLEDVEHKLNEISTNLNSTNVGVDLRLLSKFSYYPKLNIPYFSYSFQVLP